MLTKLKDELNMQRNKKEVLGKYMESLGLPVIDIEIMHVIHQLRKEFEAKAARDLNHLGLSGSQIDILGTLLIYKSTTSTELAELLKVSKANLTGMIRRLERKGFLARVESEEDGRSKDITLTNYGKEVVEKLIPTHFEKMSKNMATIPLSEKKALIKNLELILKPLLEEREEHNRD